MQSGFTIRSVDARLQASAVVMVCFTLIDTHTHTDRQYFD